jgi:hypothetical protein
LWAVTANCKNVDRFQKLQCASVYFKQTFKENWGRVTDKYAPPVERALLGASEKGRNDISRGAKWSISPFTARSREMMAQNENFDSYLQNRRPLSKIPCVRLYLVKTNRLGKTAPDSGAAVELPPQYVQSYPLGL